MLYKYISLILNALEIYQFKQEFVYLNMCSCQIQK